MSYYKTPYVYQHVQPSSTRDTYVDETYDRGYHVYSGDTTRTGWSTFSDSEYHRGETLPLRSVPTPGPAAPVDSRYRAMPPVRQQKPRIGNLELLNPMESEALLEQGPVKFGSSWESRNIPNDELNFKNIANTEEPAGEPPKDRFNMVYLILMLFGTGSLMPWNMHVTANAYFVDLKLNVNESNIQTEDFRRNFLSYLGVACQVPNVLCSGLNLFLHTGGGNFTKRIIISLIITVVMFIVSVALAILDSSDWPGLFFYITMASIVLMSMGNGVYQNCIYGLAAKLPMKFSNAILVGTNISGTLAASFNVLSIAVVPDLRTAVIYSFVSAIFILLLALDTYFALPLTRFYKYYDKLTMKALVDRKLVARSPPYWLIFKQIWPQCFNVFFVFFVTLTNFPAVLINIFPLDQNFILPTTYFTPVTCFLCFNFFAMFGNILANWIRWPGPCFLWIPVFLRSLMIPYFMLCNYKPDHRVLPVLINNDWAYIGMSVFHGLTSGYCSSLAMMFVP
ncbi:equilibrative nucleoside transporter 3-like isoform X2 [Limulus polyphemus]|nr:equilibrative nucleoside transporter 3-like isoform X2 [Limulus polyphemus]